MPDITGVTTVSCSKKSKERNESMSSVKYSEDSCKDEIFNFIAFSSIKFTNLLLKINWFP